MTCNLGKTDRILRVVFGTLLAAVGLYFGGTPGIVLVVIGAIPLLTGLVGFCPAYTLFKIDTCKMNKG